MFETYTLRFYQYDGNFEEVRQVTVRDKNHLRQVIRELWSQEGRENRYDEVEVK